MELALIFLVFFPLTANVFVNTLALYVNGRVHLVEVSLLIIVGLLDLRIPRAESSEFLNLGGKSVFLVFDFRFNLDNKLIELLERFTLGVIQLFLEL